MRKVSIFQGHDRGIEVRIGDGPNKDKMLEVLHRQLAEHLLPQDDSNTGSRFRITSDVGVDDQGSYVHVTVVDTHPGALDKRPLLARMHRALRRKMVAAGAEVDTPEPDDPDDPPRGPNNKPAGAP